MKNEGGVPRGAFQPPNQPYNVVEGWAKGVRKAYGQVIRHIPAALRAEIYRLGALEEGIAGNPAITADPRVLDAAKARLGFLYPAFTHLVDALTLYAPPKSKKVVPPKGTKRSKSSGK